MVDKNSPNYCTRRKVFGLDFVASKVLSCQMHYKNDVIGHPSGLVSYRDLFKNICQEMCSIATIGEYNEKKEMVGWNS